MKEQLRALFAALLGELDVARRMAPHLAELRAGSRPGERFLVLAFGKAARAMALAVRDGLPDATLRGLVVPPEPDHAPLPPFTVIAGGHPLPTAGSLAAGRRALELARDVGDDETVLFLVSGGGSAMLEQPLDDRVTLDELREVNRALVGSGADIVAINTVRMHLSAIKGGRLAAAAQRARRFVTLEVRDVPRRAGAAVASGPSLPCLPPLAACRQVIDRYALWDAVPAPLRPHLRAVRANEATSPALPPHSLTTVLDDRMAADALAALARRAGLVTVVDDLDDVACGAAAERLLRRLDRLRRRHAGHPVAVVGHGELSVPLPPQPGVGGRNQQFALQCARRIRGRPIAVLSCGTDGIDGNSPAAGAVVDGTTCARARRSGHDVGDHLRRCDAFPLLQALGDAVVIGPTGTNVRDVRLLVHRG